MAPRIRKTLWIGGFTLVALVGLALAVPAFVDINRYHDTIEAQAEKLLGREVTLGTMRLTLLPLPGVEVTPLAVASDRPGDPPLLKVEAVSAHVRILPLLGRRIEVASLIVRHPDLVLHRYPDGRFNLPTFPETKAASPAPANAAPSSSGSGLGLSKLRIHDARLRFVDEGVSPGKTLVTTLNGVNLAVDGYAPGRPFSVNLEMSLPPRDSGSLGLRGTLALPPGEPGPSIGTTSLTLRLKKFQPGAFAAYLKAMAGIDPPRGSLTADLKARGRIRTAAGGKWELDGDGSLSGSMAMRGVALRPSAPGAKPISAGDLDLAVDVSVEDDGHQVSFRRLELSTGKTHLEVGGSMKLGQGASAIDVTVRPSQVMAQDLAPAAALLGARFPAGLSSRSPIRFSGSAAGPLDHPQKIRFRGEIALAGVRYQDPALGRPIEEAGGTLTFENGALKVTGFTARVGETRLGGSLALEDFRSPRITLALSSPRANLDDLMALLTPSAPARGSSPAASGTSETIARIRGQGTIRVDEGSFGTFRFSRFDGNLRLENRIVTFDPVSFRLYGGTYRGALSVDLGSPEPRYTYKSNLAGVNGQQFLAENMGVKDLLSGSVNADLVLDGTGSNLDQILQSVRGRGTIRVEKGWIGQLNVMEGLTKVSNFLGERTLARVSHSLAKDRTEFTSLTGDIDVAGGRATTRNLQLTSKDIDLTGAGSFTLAGVLDLDLKVLFSKDMTDAMLQEGSRARYLEREGDRIVLPLTIKGPLAKPTYGVDLRAITRAAARSETVQRLTGSKSALGQLAQSILGGPAAPETPAAPAARRPEETRSPSVAPAGEAAGSPVEGGIAISSSKYEGGLLFPDLTIRGEFSGVGLTSADLRVEDKGGRALFEKRDAFREIGAYYAAHDRTAPARIPFKMKIDGKKIAGSGDLRITITLRRADGTSATHSLNEKKPGL